MDSRAVPPLPPRLSESLEGILSRPPATPEQAVPFGRILEALKGRGVPVVMVLLVLPFVVPVSLPGLSTPIGLVLMLFGLRVTFGKHPWWPRWFLRRTVPQAALERLIHHSVRLVRWIEKWLKPRMHFLQRWPVFRMINGAGIFLSGFALSLPIPLPFTNTLPAWAVLLLAMGMMEEDGLFILLGYGMVVATWAYFIALAWAGKFGLHTLFHF